jgi:hypothetical protein
MNKEQDFEVVDLGVASIETQGAPGIVSEPHNQQLAAGISDAD